MTKLDRIYNEYVRRHLDVTDMAGKTRDNRLRWFGGVRREKK